VSDIQLERILTETEAAALYGFSRDTLRRRTERGEGPSRIKISPRRIGYRLRDLLNDIKQCETPGFTGRSRQSGKPSNTPK
jgi:predicted DNA-binding transcriptional regulator AlpA